MEEKLNEWVPGLDEYNPGITILKNNFWSGGINWGDENKLEVKFIFVTEPKVKLGEYTNLKVKKEKVKVTKEEVEHEIHHLVENYAELVTKEGKVENGNIAIIDFEGFKDGVAFEGGKGENYSLEIGSHTFIPGFEEAVIGMKKDEEKDINVKLCKINFTA